MNKWCSLLLAFSGFAATFASDCSDMQIVACSLMIDPHKLQNAHLWRETEEDLDTHCTDFLPAIKCLNDYAESCSDSVESGTMELFKGNYQVLNKLCTKGTDLRRKYLNNAKCMNNNHAKFEGKCGTAEDLENVFIITKSHCDTYDKLIQCYYNEVETACGADAISVLKESVAPSNAFMKSHCDKFGAPVASIFGKHHHFLYSPFF